MPRLHARIIALGLLALATPVIAQEQEPPVPPLTRQRIAPFVADVRVMIPRFKQDPLVATALGIAAADLPVRGLGLLGGAHVYPIRKGSFAVGVGAEMLRGRASKTVEAAGDGAPEGPAVKSRWSHFSPQVSLNFGSRDGWSYLTVGRGKSKVTSELEDDPQPERETGATTLNYGGGARWFARKHLAFNLDLRFYSIDAQEAAAGSPGTSKGRMLVFSGGVSIR
jgi:hypothetical protein